MTVQIKSVPNTAKITVNARDGTGNIKLTNETIVTGGGSNDYNTLINKPTINCVTVEGNKTLEDYGNWKIGDGLKISDQVVSVDTATDVEQDNTKPITSAAVYVTVGNIDSILKTI